VQTNEAHVVLLQTAAAKTVDVSHDRLDQFFRRRRRVGDELLEPGSSAALALRIHRVGDPVGIQRHGHSGLDRELGQEKGDRVRRHKPEESCE
jgi:hypothetical protein